MEVKSMKKTIKKSMRKKDEKPGCPGRERDAQAESGTLAVVPRGDYNSTRSAPGPWAPEACLSLVWVPFQELI